MCYTEFIRIDKIRKLITEIKRAENYLMVSALFMFSKIGFILWQ